MKTEKGVMLIKNGMGWGKVYEESIEQDSLYGYSISYGWMPLEDAPIYDPRYCTEPADVTYSGDHNLSEIKTGKIIPVVKTIHVEVK